MDVRPYVTAGVAIASAGALIAAMPAVISPLVTNDVKIAAADPKTSSRDVALAATLEEFIDAFFEGGFTDVTQLWLTENNADPNQDEFINAFFDGFADADYEYPGGFSEVVRRWLLWNTADPNQIAAIKQLFGGGFSEVAQQFLVDQTADPAHEVLIMSLLTDGGVAASRNNRVNSLAPPPKNPFIPVSVAGSTLLSTICRHAKYVNPPGIS